MDTMWSPYGRLAFSKFTDENADKKNNGKLRYSCALYLPKNREGLRSLDNAGMTDAAAATVLKGVEEFKATVQEAMKTEAPKNMKISKIFKDGDKYADDKVAEWELDNDEDAPDYLNSTKNMYILQLSTEFAPKIVGPKMAAGELPTEEAYDGCWIRCLIRGYGWSYNGTKGWSLGLGGTVQKWQDAPAYGSASSADVEGEDAMELAPSADADDFID